MGTFDKEVEFLKEYNDKLYEKPSVTNDILIFTTEDKFEENTRKIPKKGMQVLLIKRDSYPYKDNWSIPGGFIKINEGIEEGAIRKLREKTGIKDVYLEQLYTFGEVNRDSRTRVISIGSLALLDKESLNYVNSEYIKEAKWFWVEKKLINSKDTEELIINKYYLNINDEDINISYEVVEEIEKSIVRKSTKIYKLLDESKGKLAFDHYKIIDYGIDRLRNKVEYTPIAFNLLPRLFTVKELQNVYEAIMGREILNFRRKMGNMIIETDERIEGKPYRPAQVYKFNTSWNHEF